MYTILKPLTRLRPRAGRGFVRAGFAFFAAMLIFAGCDTGSSDSSPSATNPNPDLRVVRTLEALQALLYSPVFEDIVVDGIIEQGTNQAASTVLNIADSRTVTLTKRAQLKGVTVVVYRGSRLVTESDSANWVAYDEGTSKGTKVFIRPGAELVGTRDFTAIPEHSSINIFEGAVIKNAEVAVGQREIYQDINKATVSLEVRHGQLGLQEGGKFYFGIAAEGGGASILPDFESGHDSVAEGDSVVAFDTSKYEATAARLWDIAISDEIALGNLYLHDPFTYADPEVELIAGHGNLEDSVLIAEAAIDVNASGKPVQIGNLTLNFANAGVPYPSFVKVQTGQLFVAANPIIVGEFPATLPAGLSFTGSVKNTTGGDVLISGAITISGKPMLSSFYDLAAGATVTVLKDSYIAAPKLELGGNAEGVAMIRFQDNLTFTTTNSTTVKVETTGTDADATAVFKVVGKADNFKGSVLGEAAVRPTATNTTDTVGGKTYRIGEISVDGAKADVETGLNFIVNLKDDGFARLNLGLGPNDSLTGGTLFAREAAGTNEVTVANARLMSVASKGALFVETKIEPGAQKATFQNAMLNLYNAWQSVTNIGDRVDFLLTSGTASNTSVKAVGPKAAIGSEEGVYLRETELGFALPFGAEAIIDAADLPEGETFADQLDETVANTRAITGGAFTLGANIVANVSAAGGVYVQGGTLNSNGRINLSGVFAVNTGKYSGKTGSRLIIENTARLSVGVTGENVDAGDAFFELEGAAAPTVELDFSVAGPPDSEIEDLPEGAAVPPVTNPDLERTVGIGLVWKSPLAITLAAQGDHKAELNLNKAAGRDNIFRLRSFDGDAAVGVEIKNGNMTVPQWASVYVSAGGTNGFALKNVSLAASTYLEVDLGSKLTLAKLTGTRAGDNNIASASAYGLDQGNSFFTWRTPGTVAGAVIANAPKITNVNYYGSALWGTNAADWNDLGDPATPFPGSTVAWSASLRPLDKYVWFEHGTNVTGWINLK